MALDRDTRGVVFVEFILAFTPVLTLFLCTVQMALLHATELAVQHAAVVGARAAMVVFEEDPVRYDGEPRRSLGDGESEAVDMEYPLSATASPPEASSRAGAVRGAVALALAPFAPAWSLDGGALRLSGRTLVDAVGHWEERLLFGLRGYPDLGLAVTYPVEPGSSELHRRVIGGESVTVRVTYLAPCQVPLAARLLCVGSSGLLASGLGASSEGEVPDLQGLRRPGLVLEALALGVRFAVMKAESTMPLQRAGYEGGAS